MSDGEQKGFFDGNPKMIFAFGLVTGIAITSMLGGQISLPRVNSDAVAVGNGNTGNIVAPTPTAGVAPAGEMPAVTKDDYVRGDLKKAKVVVVEYSDFQCPFCERHHPTLQALKDKYGDKVAWVYRHYPLTSIHPEAMPAAIASECAGQQNKFWEFGDAMFANQSALGDEFYKSTAQDLGLNMGKFNTCLTSDSAKQAVTSDQAGGDAAGVSGTPATFINGQMVTSSSGNSVGAAPQSVFEQIIDGIIGG